jgi:ATP-dependent Clp protease ATP-binding subunit ClpA
VFEWFTDGARRVVVLAQEEARLLNHNYIGTEHLLLGLIHEDKGVAAKALESLDISLEAVRLQVEQIVGHGRDADSGHIPFTPAAKKALELSTREALQLGNKYIGTEHILLGLIREGEGVAAQVLVKLGADLSRTRQQVTQLRPEEPERVHRLLVQSAIDEQIRWSETRWSTRAERFLMTHKRWVPNFLIGWPTWFGNRKASGLRGLPGDLAYLRASLFKRSDNSD